MGVYLLTKAYKSCTFEFWFSFVFLYGKLTFFVLFLLVSAKYAMYYFLLCIVTWIALAHPQLPSNSSKMVKVRELDELGLNIDAVLQGQRQKNEAKSTGRDFTRVSSTVLVFTAGWADTCFYTAPLWHKFANKFSTSRVRFFEIDVHRFPEIAKAFKINTQGVANQLPSLVLLEDEREYLRFPPVDIASGKQGRVVNYKERELVKYFDLDSRHLATKFLSN